MLRKTGKIILCRHGESVWNKQNKFTGWSNISLTNKGIQQSYNIFNKLKNNNLTPDIIYTSKLKRAIHTSLLIRQSFDNIPDIKIKWQLNERNYGELEGVNREYAKNYYGKENIKNIREKLHYLPVFKNKIPLLDYENENIIYNGESNNMIKKRIDYLWNNELNNLLENNKLLLIVSHKNVLRILIKNFENINDKDFEKIDVGNASPILYDFDKNSKLIL